MNQIYRSSLVTHGYLPVSKMFLPSALLYIGIAMVTLAFILGTVIVKSWRVANENPVLSIKSE